MNTLTQQKLKKSSDGGYVKLSTIGHHGVKKANDKGYEKMSTLDPNYHEKISERGYEKLSDLSSKSKRLSNHQYDSIENLNADSDYDSGYLNNYELRIRDDIVIFL